MKEEQLSQEGSPFESIRREDEEGNEYWSARDLEEVLGYTNWRNFKYAIEKAKVACRNSHHDIADHFDATIKMIQAGKGAKRQVEDYHLSRYACYLLVENADPTKPVVALGQTYFATKARKAELLEESQRIFTYDQLMGQTEYLRDAAAKIAGIVRARDFAIFQDHGYRGLYAGETARDIHARKGLKKSQSITDYMGRAELAANWFRATQAEQALHNQNITDPEEANKIHYHAGERVRQAMQEISGVMPEEMPTPTDSIHKVKRKRLKPGPKTPAFGNPLAEDSEN